MRLLLVNSPVPKPSPHARLAPPLGLAYLAGEARRNGHDVEILDLNLSGYNRRRVDLALKRFGPDVVGVSAFTETYPNALAIATQVKEYSASILVVMGGSHPSILPSDVAAESCVDAVVVGEGERTLVELLAAIGSGDSLKGVLGLVWKDGGQIISNERRTPAEPDEIGLPARDLLSLEFYPDAFNVLSARGGCPYKCPFCSASHIWNGKHRPRDPKAVVDEIEMLVRSYGATYVFFVDDIFTLRREWVERLLDEMERLGGAVAWGCGTRVDRVDEDLLARMARTGCVGIQYGVESGAQDVLDSVKGIEREAASEAVERTVRAGINATASFMVPFPQDTEETLRQTFEFMETLKNLGAEISMSFTTPYPGTVFYEDAEELGIRILTRDWAEYDAKHLVMDTKHLPAERVYRIVEEHAHRMGLLKTA